MNARRSVRIVKKVQQDGVWKFVPPARNGTRYVWDPRPGAYYLDSWEGRRRKEYAGETPSAALTAQRRKQHEFAERCYFRSGRPFFRRTAMRAGDRKSKPSPAERPDAPGGSARFLSGACGCTFLPISRKHTAGYCQVLEHFERHASKKRFVEAVTRADIDEYKIRRCQEQSQRHNRVITARNVNSKSVRCGRSSITSSKSGASRPVRMNKAQLVEDVCAFCT